MITCVVDYTIDPAKLDAFERFARAWIGLVNARGGQHHGYFLPGEGASRNVTTQRLQPAQCDNATVRTGRVRGPAGGRRRRVRTVITGHLTCCARSARDTPR